MSARIDSYRKKIELAKRNFIPPIWHFKNPKSNFFPDQTRPDTNIKDPSNYTPVPEAKIHPSIVNVFAIRKPLTFDYYLPNTYIKTTKSPPKTRVNQKKISSERTDWVALLRVFFLFFLQIADCWQINLGGPRKLSNRYGGTFL